MDAEIIELKKITLIGMKVTTSLSESKTYNLWHSFKKRVSEVKNRIDDNYYSVQFYPAGIEMDSLTPITEFEKWAAVAVSSPTEVPVGMECFEIESGKFAKFKHKGVASDFFRTSQHIFGTWLPASEYKLRHAHHFEIMDNTYKGPEDPDSEEDVYIPIQ